MKNIFLILFTVVFLLYGCSNDANPAPGDDPIQVDPDPMNNPDPQTEENSVKLAEDATFGKILTDSEGKTLYFFSLDTKDTSACTRDRLPRFGRL